MGDASALRIAIELLHVPAMVRILRRSPLPADTLLLLRLAADDAEAAREAEALSGRSRETNKLAAIFFIEQVLLAPGHDSYRMLGLGPEASSSDLRAHMALLLKWLHPDLRREDQRDVLTRRVIDAWDRIKTPERRRQFDRMLGVKASEAATRKLGHAGTSAKIRKVRSRAKLGEKGIVSLRRSLLARVRALLAGRRGSSFIRRAE